MSSTQESLVSMIQAAVAASPELQKQLAAIKSTDEAAALLTSAMGSPVTAADLNDISDAAKAQMTDQELDAVAGGGWKKDTFIAVSVLVIGACAAGSIYAEITDGKGGCKAWMQDSVRH